MNKLIAVAVLLILAGCTTNAKTHVVRGVSGIEVDCSGLGSGWEKCRKRADRECKGVVTRWSPDLTMPKMRTSFHSASIRQGS